MIQFLTSKNLVVVFISIFILACQKDEKQAIGSLEGVWQVTAINSFYGNGGEKVQETGDLGTFSFEGEMVEYSFTRNDTFFQNLRPWTLSVDKVRQGFFRETQFLLEIEDDFHFEIQFEDGTHNAEKNARNMSLDTHAQFLETGLAIELELTKE